MWVPSVDSGSDTWEQIQFGDPPLFFGFTTFFDFLPDCWKT